MRAGMMRGMSGRSRFPLTANESSRPHATERRRYDGYRAGRASRLLLWRKEKVRHILFSSGGGYVAPAAFGATMQLWSLDDGLTFMGHEGPMVFSQPGRGCCRAARKARCAYAASPRHRRHCTTLRDKRGFNFESDTVLIAKSVLYEKRPEQ